MFNLPSISVTTVEHKQEEETRKSHWDSDVEMLDLVCWHLSCCTPLTFMSYVRPPTNYRSNCYENKEKSVVDRFNLIRLIGRMWMTFSFPFSYRVQFFWNASNRRTSFWSSIHLCNSKLSTCIWTNQHEFVLVWKQLAYRSTSTTCFWC